MSSTLVNPKAISRSVRSVRTGVIDVDREGPLRARGFCFSLAFVFLLPIALDPLGPQILWNDLRHVFDRETLITEALESRNRLFEDLGQPPATRAQVAAELPMRIDGLFWVAAPALLILVALFWPRVPPFRVDGHRALAYTYARGRLWVQPYGQDAPLASSEPAQSYLRLFRDQAAMFSGLRFTLHAADGSARTAKFLLGTQPPTGIQQWVSIGHAITTVAENGGLDPFWVADLDRHRGFHWTDLFRWPLLLTLSPRPKRRIAKMEAAVEAYLRDRA